MMMALYLRKKMSVFSRDTYVSCKDEQLHDWLESESEPPFLFSWLWVTILHFLEIELLLYFLKFEVPSLFFWWWELKGLLKVLYTSELHGLLIELRGKVMRKIMNWFKSCLYILRKGLNLREEPVAISFREMQAFTSL